MVNIQRRIVIAGLLLVALVSPLVTFVRPAAAATAGTLSYVSTVGGATCALTRITVSFSVLGTVADSQNLDRVVIAVFDATGKQIDGIDLAVAVGVTRFGFVSVGLNNITARPVTVRLVDTDGSENTAGRPVLASFNIDPASVSANCAGLPVGSGASGPLFTDGRINNRAGDAAQTAAIYCERDGGVTIWAVTNSVGTYDFTATKQEIDAVPAKPTKNTLIKQGLGVALYRLVGGKMQVNAPNGYVYIWDGC